MDHRLRKIFLAVLLVLPVANDAGGREYVDRIVAVVNDEIITLSELNAEVKPYTEKIEADSYPAAQKEKMLYSVREQVLKTMIDQKLTDQKIKKANITVSGAEVHNTIERIKEARLLTDEELRMGLRQQGLTIEEYQEKIRMQILRTKLVNLEVKSKIVITQEDIDSYYKNHPELYGGTQKYRLKHIIRKPPLLGDEKDRQAVSEKMEKILEQLGNGVSFERLAVRYSESPLAGEGGDLGAFELKSLSPQIRDAVKDLKAGEYTGILETDQGHQIFYVESIIDSPGKSVEAASGEIHEKLFNEIVDKKFQGWLEDLRNQSHIKIIN